MDRQTVFVLLVIFVATLIRSAFGFGEALIAVPLLAVLLVPVEVAAPLAVLVSITVAGIVVVRDWRKIHFASAWRLILATLFGTPLGLLLLKTATEAIVKAILAIFIVSFSIYCLLVRKRSIWKDDRAAWLFGFLAGISGGAYGMNGPPLVIYGTFRGWSSEQFRATLQGYFLPVSIVGMFGYWLTDLWVPAVTRYYFLTLVPALAAIFLGGWLNRRMRGQRFILYVHLGLIVVGMTLLIQSL